MSRNKSTNTMPTNDGINSTISICSGNASIEVKNVVYVSEDDGSICFARKEKLLFHVIFNADILSIIPKVELKVNKNSLRPGSMYILDVKDRINCGEHEFFFKESHYEEKVTPKEISLSSNDVPPDITQEIKVSSLSSTLKNDGNLEKLNINKKEEITEKQNDKKESRIGKYTALFKLDKEKSNLDSDQKSANPLVRVFAVFLDIAIACIILEFIVIEPEVLSMLSLENLPGLDQLSITKASIEKLISIPLIFYTTRIIGALIFGVSFGQAILGMSETSSVLVKRIKGPLREVIGALTGVVILFDLPCLFGRRTLKEFVTSTKLISSGFLKTFILGFVSLITFSCVWLTLPILNSKTSLESIVVDETMLKMTKKNTSETYKKSEFFNIAVSSQQNILPFFYYKRSGKSIIGQPQLDFYNEKNKSTIKFIKKVDFRNVLVNVKNNNVVIESFFPEVAKILFDPKLKELKISAVREVIKLTKESFDLNLDTIVEHVLNRGPFVTPYLNYRFALESVINSKFTKISYANIANHPYMVFHSTKHARRIMGISISDSNIFDIQTRDKNFEKKLHSSNMKSSTQDSLLNLVDILYQKEFSNLKLKKAFEISFKFLESAYKGNVQIKKEDILNSFESQFNYINLIKRTLTDENEKSYLDKYVQNLSDLLRAYKESDASYFGDTTEITEENVKDEIDSLNIKDNPKGESFE